MLKHFQFVGVEVIFMPQNQVYINQYDPFDSKKTNCDPKRLL